MCNFKLHVKNIDIQMCHHTHHMQYIAKPNPSIIKVYLSVVAMSSKPLHIPHRSITQPDALLAPASLAAL